jgi:molybdopterin molybdotransferase
MAQDIISAEAALGQSLPGDYRESLLIHDGQVPDQFGCSPGFLFGLNLYPIAKAASRRQGLLDLVARGLGQDLSISTHGPVRPAWWDRLWVPIADDGNNNYCCLDLNPAAGGHVGQVVKVWNESNLRSVQSRSFRDWLTVFADLLEVGEFVYSEAHNGLISLEDSAADGVV